MRITPILTRSSLVLAGATLAVGIIACTAGTSTDNAIPALDAPAPVSESTWTDAPIERLPAPQVVVTTPPAVEVAPVEVAPASCESQGLITAEDMTCVPESFYDDVAPASPLAPVTLYPCETEDSEMCYWDAARMGNGQGRSFVRVFGETFYADTAPGRLTAPRQRYDNGTLECGVNATPVTDVDPYGNAWAYCEPN